MALNRRQFMLSVPVGCALLQACASGQVSPTAHYYAEIARSKNANAKETILVCMPQTHKPSRFGLVCATSWARTTTWSRSKSKTAAPAR